MINRIIFLALLLALGNGTLFSQKDSAPTNDAGIQYLGHVAIGVSDLGRAMNFYHDQLGLTEVFRLNGPTGSSMLIYLRVNNDNFIELFPGLERQAEGESKGTGLRHLGFCKPLCTLSKREGFRYPIMLSNRRHRSELTVRFCILSETRMAMRLN